MFAALARYADFNGRGSRSEYWLFSLLLCIVFPITLVLDFILFPNGYVDEYGETLPIFLLTGIAYIGILVPGYSALVRRLHDTNRSGWWLFISAVPLVGAILLLVWTCQPGDPRRNRFGAPPRETPGRIDEGGQRGHDNRFTHLSPPPHERASFGYETSATPFAPVPTRPAARQTEDAWMDRLEQMAKLREQGILTDEEFAAEKAVLLAGVK